MKIENIENLKKLYNDLSKQKVWSFDTETTIGEVEKLDKETDKEYQKRRLQLLKSDLRLHPKKTKLYSVAFYFPDKLYYLEIKDFDYSSNELFIEFLQILQKIFSLLSIKIAHRATFDINVLENFGVKIYPPIWCSKTMACIHNENDVTGHDKYGLKILAKKYLKQDNTEIINVETQDISEIPAEKRLEYCGKDAILSYQLAEYFYQKLKKEKLLRVFKIEMDIVLLIAEIERNGLRVDKEFLSYKLQDVKSILKQTDTLIIKKSGKDFDINSPQQLSGILYKELKLPIFKKTPKTKMGSTDTFSLEQLKERHPIIPLLLSRKKLEKIQNTYLQPYLEKEYKDRVYPKLQAWGTRTGRFSSSSPNFHQLPKGEAESKIPKQAILPDTENHILICADFSQLEYRMLAHYCQELKLLRAYRNNPDTDFHQLVADQLEVVRERAKQINFATVYGQSAYSLAESLGISEQKAKNFQRKYFINYPRIESLKNKVLNSTRKNEYVRNLFGRKRRLPEINSNNEREREHAERQAFNFVIQSSATGDLMKLVMYRLDKELKKCYNTDTARLIWCVHDEIIISCDTNETQRVAKITQNIMENIIKLKVPLKVDIKVKNRWEEIC